MIGPLSNSEGDYIFFHCAAIYYREPWNSFHPRLRPPVIYILSIGTGLLLTDFVRTARWYPLCYKIHLRMTRKYTLSRPYRLKVGLKSDGNNRMYIIWWNFCKLETEMSSHQWKLWEDIFLRCTNEVNVSGQTRNHATHASWGAVKFHIGYITNALKHPEIKPLPVVPTVLFQTPVLHDHLKECVGRVC